MTDKDKSLENLNRSGRQKGSKNKTTLFKEAMREGFETKLATDGQKVFDAVVERAIGVPMRDDDGKIMKDPETGEVIRGPADMSAAKMIMDRIVPVQENQGKGALRLGEGGLTIHIEKLEAHPANVGETVDITEADYEEID